MVSLLFIPIFPSFSCSQSTGLLPLSPTKAQRADMPRHPSNSFSLPFWAGLIRHSAFIFFFGPGPGPFIPAAPGLELHLLFPRIPLLSLSLSWACPSAPRRACLIFFFTSPFVFLTNYLCLLFFY